MISQHDFILLDGSGSMGSMWAEVLQSVNVYVQKLAHDNIDTGVTVVVFDSLEPFKVLRDRITPKTFKRLTNEDFMPRGMTPLNDATIDLINLAERGAPWGGQYDRVCITIATDGAENASTRHFGYQGTQLVRARLDTCRAKGWQVIYLGANFDNTAQATSYGAAAHSTVSSVAGNLADTMFLNATKRGAYSLTGQNMVYSAEEKTAARAVGGLKAFVQAEQAKAADPADISGQVVGDTTTNTSS